MNKLFTKISLLLLLSISAIASDIEFIPEHGPFENVYYISEDFTEDDVKNRANADDIAHGFSDFYSSHEGDESFLGGAIALGVLFASYKVFAAKLQAPEVLLGPVQIRFLSVWGTGALLLIGMAMAWLGSYFSLRQSLRP